MTLQTDKSWPITITVPQVGEVSGVAVWATQLAHALAQCGHVVRLVMHGTDHCDGPYAASSNSSPDRLRIIPARRLDDASATHAHVAFYHGLLPMIWIPPVSADCYCVAAALASVVPDQLRIAAWTHSDNPHDYAVLTYYEHIIHRFIAISSTCLAAIRQRIPTRNAFIEHVPHGVESLPYVARPPLMDRPVRLIYAGRLEDAQKRVSDLLHLADCLLQQNLRFELRLVGDGPQTPSLQERIDAMRFRLQCTGSDVRLLPPVSHNAMAEIWSWADVALLMSSREGFSLSVLESMSCGCVPVVSRVQSGIDDIIRDGENGLTFPIGDIVRAAEHISSLIHDPLRLQYLSHAARQTVLDHYTYSHFASHVERILRDVGDAPIRAWPLDRPTHMRSSTFGMDATVPATAADRMRCVLRKIADLGLEPIAIFGAGHHTRALASILAESPARIVAVLDDDDRLTGTCLWGWPVTSPNFAAHFGIRAVVISSWLYEDEILGRHGTSWAVAGTRVFRLYAPPDERPARLHDLRATASPTSVSIG